MKSTMFRARPSAGLLLLGALVGTAACGSGGGALDAGDAGADTGGGGGNLPAGFFSTPLTPPFTMTGPNDPRSVQVVASGEALAETGFDYTATPPEGEVGFVDGWEVRFDKYLVVVGNVTLSTPGPDPAQRQTVGPTVAEAAGPWLVDLHRAGAVSGAGEGEHASPLALLRMPTAGGQFDTAARYAFSFRTVPASGSMSNVNVTEADRADVEQMLARGWTHFFSGTARYRGRAASATVDPTFVSYPTEVRFRFGFGAPAQYINCHNPQLGEEDTPANRGIQASMTGPVRAQLTMHTDHFFWDQADVEGTPLRFDALAARSQGFGMGAMAAVSMDDLMGVSLTAPLDRANMPVIDRSNMTMGQSGVGPLAYRRNSAMNVNDLRDFVAYNARQQGHLNSDGLCFVQPSGPLAF